MSDLLNLGANVVSYQKGNKKYGMTCAWAMQVDYDQILLLLGSQSDTGNNISIGDIVGVSALSEFQQDIANHFGDHHSSSYDKFQGIDFTIDDNAILIKNAKCLMKCEVIDIFFPKGNDLDHLVHLKVIDSKIDDNKKFLSREAMR